MLGVLLGIAVLALLLGKRGELEAARHQFRHLNLAWMAGIAAVHDALAHIDAAAADVLLAVDVLQS